MASVPRWLRRLPLHLHRRGIRGYERMLGIEWIVLETRGRRTRRPHAVVLDVVGREAGSGGWCVQPAVPTAAWVRNVRADPHVVIEADGRRVEAVAVELTGDAGADVVLGFIRTHPRYARVVVRLVGYVRDVDVPDAALRAELRSAIVFALRPSLRASDPRAARAAGRSRR